MELISLLALWLGGFIVGCVVTNAIREWKLADPFVFLKIEFAALQSIVHILSRRVVEDDIKIKEMRWMASGGIDDDQDLEDISEAKAGGDEYVEARAQALVAACRSLGMLNKSDGLQRGLETLGRLWK